MVNLYVEEGESSMLMRTCGYNNKDECLDNWPCMWCNGTHTVNETTQNYSYCKSIVPCEFNKSKLGNCEYKNKYKYDIECNALITFIYMMIFIGYYISMIIIYGTVNRLLVNEEVSINTRNSINSIVLMLTTIPLVVFFFYDTVIFYLIFICYISIGFSTYCCIKINDAPRATQIDLNIVGTSKKENGYAYSTVN
tara:strand:+ start:465 stop:1049 length:585 start_codon:yes stop_codon:yes gene_type:complete